MSVDIFVFLFLWFCFIQKKKKVEWIERVENRKWQLSWWQDRRVEAVGMRQFRLWRVETGRHPAAARISKRKTLVAIRRICGCCRLPPHLFCAVTYPSRRVTAAAIHDTLLPISTTTTTRFVVPHPPFLFYRLTVKLNDRDRSSSRQQPPWFQKKKNFKIIRRQIWIGNMSGFFSVLLSFSSRWRNGRKRIRKLTAGNYKRSFRFPREIEKDRRLFATIDMEREFLFFFFPFLSL